MKSKNIMILEELPLNGGGCDGIKDDKKGYIIRGGREMENHFECLWDLYRSIPSLKIKDASVLDEFYWLNENDPSSSPVRVTVNRGQDTHTLHKFTLSDTALLEISKLVMTPEYKLNDKKISDVFSEDFFKSNFWLFWRSMFAFEDWHSAIEMRRYLTRFIHHTSKLTDLSCLKFTTYNQYESLILPLQRYLEEYGVNFETNTVVENIEFNINDSKKVAKKIICSNKEIELNEDDFVFVTLGCNTEETSYGNNDTPAKLNKTLGPSWTLWKNIAAQSNEFGNPDRFCGNVEQSNWKSATITCYGNKVPNYIKKLTGRDSYNGKIVTGGPITAKDSSWLMSFTVSRQPHFEVQKENEIVAWVYGLFSDVPGDFVKKPMRYCTGKEICMEWLYHIGVPENEIEELASHCNTIPCMMPYVTSYFMNRKVDDRPLIVPDKAVNFAFIGEHVETPGDTVFTTEYAVRTAMEAVYTLMDVKRGVPEVFASSYDIRVLLQATAGLLDGIKITDIKLPLPKKIALKTILDKTDGTVISDLLNKYNLK